MAEATSVRLESILELTFTLRADTGLHIGAGDKDIEIGGIDMPVIRNPLNRRPYVPGSSLKGKLRSLLDRRYGLEANQNVGGSRIHLCKRQDDLAGCAVCPIFGVSAEGIAFHPTLLSVADLPMTQATVDLLESRATDAYLTEAKSEVAIDRITAASNPRTQERVPAGSEFGPGRITLAHYGVGERSARLDVLLEGLQLLELDYLGGGGSRGNGRISLHQIRPVLHRFPAGSALEEHLAGEFASVADLVASRDALLSI